MSKFSRRALVAGSAALPALGLPTVAIATPSIASPTTDAVSFPALVAQFVRVRDRWRAQRALDRAHIDKIRKLCPKAIGMSYDQYLALEVDDPRWEKANSVLSKIPEDDPVDEDGCSIAWNEIDGELWPMTQAMLNETPRSLTDLAWQAEVLLTADPELADGSLVRKLLKNIFALSGTNNNR